jgi:NAD(P)H-hydrate epimerase
MSGIPALTAGQMARVDEIMLIEFGVEPIQLMELAGHAVATRIRTLAAAGDAPGGPVVFLAGNGGNGGDALVAARFLRAWGAQVTVVLSKPAPDYAGLPARHLRTLERLEVRILDGATIDRLPEATIVVDGLLGFSTIEAPRGTTARLIDMANGHDAYRLAIDVPSGIEATTGAAFAPCIVAAETITLGLPKTGLMTGEAVANTGRLVLADIGIPPAAYARVGVAVPGDLFATSGTRIVRD